jgi:integrase
VLKGVRDRGLAPAQQRQRLYRHLVKDVDRYGKVRLYVRRKGQPKVRLTEKPGTASFEAEYQRAFRGELTSPAVRYTPSRPGSLRWLCEQYYASVKFKSLASSTRKVTQGILAHICQEQIGDQIAGDLPFALMESRHVAKLRDEKAALPEAANARVKALRQLFAWACSPEYGLATKNPALAVGYLKSNNPGGFPPWSEEDVAKYETRHPVGTKARLALDLFLYTGVRRSDAVKLGPQMERDGKLLFSEEKGRQRTLKTHALPILPPLRASIDATAAQRSGGGHLVYLPTEFGEPYSVKGFGNWFKRRCREAGVTKELSAHGLRKLSAQRCAEAGATEQQLMALFGWTTGKQAAHYTRAANKVRIEAAAAATLLGVQPGNKSGEAKGAIAQQDSNKSVQPSAEASVGAGEEPAITQQQEKCPTFPGDGARSDY